MKKLWFYTLIVVGLSLTTCSSPQASQETENVDSSTISIDKSKDEQNQSTVIEANPVGENIEGQPVPVAAEEDTKSFVRFSANGTKINCVYISKDINPKASIYEHKEDNSFTAVLIERGSEIKMKEKLVLKLLNFDMKSLTFPVELKVENDNQKMSIIYSVRKNGSYENYYTDDFYLIINSFTDGVLEGAFKATAKHTKNNEVINLENGTFKVLLEDTVI